MTRQALKETIWSWALRIATSLTVGIHLEQGAVQAPENSPVHSLDTANQR